MIFVVGDETSQQAGQLGQTLTQQQPGCTIRTFLDTAAVLSALRDLAPKPGVLVSTQPFCEDSLSFVKQVRASCPDTACVWVVCAQEKPALLGAVRQGLVFSVLEKPVDPDTLLLVVRNALDRADWITRLRQTEQAARQSEQARQQADTRFLAAQERLLESERLAAVGRVASGIAHEIGNQLSVLSYAEMIRDRYPADPEVRLFAMSILTARSRLGGLMSELREVSRRHSTDTESVSDLSRPMPLSMVSEPVALSLQDALLILRFDPDFRQRTITKDVADQAQARVHRDKLVQVFLNLLRNALDATQPGGHLAVRLFSEPMTQPDPRVFVQIDDFGEGISRAVMARIFEPFFTTKGERGTGLGLGICRNIVSQHGGQLLLQSPCPRSLQRPIASPGAGSRVTLILPRVL